MYLDPATGDVWFHPWGGDPRIVGHNSAAGPGGDPNGDTAAWFEGSDALERTWQLVVYDTATGREISRTLQCRRRVDPGPGEHYPRVTDSCRSPPTVSSGPLGPATYSHDVRTQTDSVVTVPKGLCRCARRCRGLRRRQRRLVLRVPGQAEQRYPDLESQPAEPQRQLRSCRSRTRKSVTPRRSSTPGPVSCGGCPERVPLDRVVIRRHRHGGSPRTQLLACDAARRTCERLPAEARS